ncbi:high mobility group B protein 15-like isoform X3 [Typha angustifolia]|uniref:high mobility group B protein 15-like isoform X3 n=1 Tax=Typha angustifolia TaxID=59011 RepID=UPI003C2CCB33
MLLGNRQFRIQNLGLQDEIFVVSKFWYQSSDWKEMNEAVNGVAEKFPDKGKKVLDPGKEKQSMALKLESKETIEEVADARNCRNINNNNYLKPLEKYEDVIADRNLFMETLKKLHAISGTKFILVLVFIFTRIPTIGGRELDLHRLFVEVTSRGGIEKVIADRRWREVTATFSFPSTATNASFVLRKYYMSLLHRYERVYFSGSQEWASPPTVPSERFIEPMMPYCETQTAAQKRKRNNGLSSPIYPAVVGVIDGKFEHGYFVTVTVGSAKLRGVLYHSPEQTAQLPRYSGIADNSNATIARRRRRRKKLSKRDPTHPKPNRSGYNFFFAEQHARLKPLHPGKDREISKMIGDLWNKLTETDKAVYQERGLKDKERYKSEMVVYRERLKGCQNITSAVPIQQCPAEQEVMVEDVNTKVDIGEDDLLLSNQIGSSSDGSVDSEGKDSDANSENETSLEGSRTDFELLPPALTEDSFELRRRDSPVSKNELDLPSSNENEET